MEGKNLSDFNVFILDTIGYLGRIYSYADIAYVGGAAGATGLHNILEPAVFGIPIIIGKNYQKFPEAKRLVNLNGVTSVNNQKELSLIMESLIDSKDKRSLQGKINASYVKQNKGAVIKILTNISTTTN